MSEISEQRDQIIEQLEELNDKIRVQNSVRHTFFKGIIYGVGVFIGSAIVATILLGIISPWFDNIDWIRDNFQRGESALGGNK